MSSGKAPLYVRNSVELIEEKDSALAVEWMNKYRLTDFVAQEANIDDAVAISEAYGVKKDIILFSECAVGWLHIWLADQRTSIVPGSRSHRSVDEHH
ncbi:hypothetical protein ANCDUO_05945 [Ancylostoma duodenale]|uniref:Uncharacterized protein n=1 Tax=Ancylostoma duodenale TaxID=51022 RepID=A0A0C2DMA4_9BILA|nr:hypothetical protein ANCDUO_05945 [Ancylostoma duodenale]